MGVRASTTTIIANRSESGKRDLDSSFSRKFLNYSVTSTAPNCSMEQSRLSGDRKGYDDELPRSVLYSGYGLRAGDVALRHESSRSGTAGGGSAGCANGVGGAFARARGPG